jgi:hypothetical protein|tara:strand:- start:1712 stop:2008 length:297 start_codon:yes stop_codon:yes gene_type:complete
MAKIRVKRAGAENHAENIVAFRKDKETGLFKMITKDVIREYKSNKLKFQKEVVSEDFYKLGTAEDHDHVFRYQDIDEAYQKIYFKKAESEDAEASSGL